MKNWFKSKLFKFLFAKSVGVAAFVLSAAFAINAQAEDAAAPPPQPQQDAAALLRQLDLSPEQIEKARLINREMRQETRLANQRLIQSRRALDEAIYSQSPNEAEVERLIGDFVKAQAEATALRAKKDFRFRQILNDRQLAVFVELRRRAAQNILRKAMRPSNPLNDERRPRRFPPKRRF